MTWPEAFVQVFETVIPAVVILGFLFYIYKMTTDF